MEALSAALDSQPPYWIVGKGLPRMTAGKTAGVARLQKVGISESEERRIATGFDSPHSTICITSKQVRHEKVYSH